MRRREMLLPVILPEAFQKVAYVQAAMFPSYVDTEYIPNQDTRVCCKFERIEDAINADSGVAVKKSFVGYGTYNMTLEYDVDDTEEHFIYLKYRKDGSVHTGSDNFKFRIRFESE